MRSPPARQLLAIALVLAMVGTAALVVGPAPAKAVNVYQLDFVPSGLPGGNWNVTWDGTEESAAYNSNIEFSLATAPSSSYTVGAYTYYTASPASGSATPGYPSATQVNVAWSLNRPTTPTGVAVTSTTETSITIRWTDWGGPISHDYPDDFSYSGGACGTEITGALVAAGLESHTFTGLSPSTRYCFYVSSGDATGVGSPSALIQGITASGPAVSISASSNPADVGESVTFTPTITGGISPYTYAWAIGATSEGSGTTLTHTFGSSGTYVVYLNVTDNVGGVGYATLSETVDAGLTVSATGNVTTVDVGYPIGFTATASAGTGGYTYSWTLNSVQESTASSFSYSFAAAGSYTMDVSVTDSAGYVQTSSVSVTVNPNPTVSATSNANPADIAYAVTFNSNEQYGTGAPTYSWTVNGVQEGTGSTLSYSFGSVGSYTVAVTVTDGEHHTGTSSLSETIAAAPSITLSASPNPTDINVNVDFTTSESGGIAPYTYAWYFNGNLNGAFTASSGVGAFSSGGSDTILVTLTDAEGHTSSSSVSETVNGGVSPSISSSQNPTDVGNAVTYTVATSGGTGSYTAYAWTEGGSSVCSSSTTCMLTMNTAGSITIGITVTDSVEGQGTNTLTETVHADPTVTISSSQNPADVGNGVTFTATASSGSGAYTYVWKVNGATQASTTSGMVYSFASAGSDTIAVTVTDADGNTGSYSFTETVNGDPTTGASASRNPSDVGLSVTFTAIRHRISPP